MIIPLLMLVLKTSAEPIPWIRCFAEVQLNNNTDAPMIAGWYGHGGCKNDQVDTLFSACNITKNRQLTILPTNLSTTELCRSFDLISWLSTLTLSGSKNQTSDASLATVKPCIQAQEYCKQDGTPYSVVIDSILGLIALGAVILLGVMAYAGVKSCRPKASGEKLALLP